MTAAPIPSPTDDLPATLARALADEGATLALGAALAPHLRAGMSVHLCGGLGAGKTTLTRGVLRAMGFAERVKSPTYTLVEPYVISGINLYHFDFYRFENPEEWESAGFREYFNSASLCLVEWPERAGKLLPKFDLRITLEPVPSSGRTATIEAGSPAGAPILRALAQSRRS
jgi:tRNA threonylcarbamoyladenosine biosynthesis protein TsaE